MRGAVHETAGVMGFYSPEGESHLDSIVFFLSEALRAAIEAGDTLQQTVCEVPQFVPGSESTEMMDELASFRRQIGDLRGLEMLLLTKILRAGELARELRLLDAALKPELDTFRLATIMAADLRDRLLPNADTAFHGAAEPRHFLEERGWMEHAETNAKGMASGYRIAGEVDVRLLLDACETLHFSLAGRYGIEAQPLLLELADEADEQDTLTDRGEDEPFLLSDFGEIVSDQSQINRRAWQRAPAGNQRMTH